MSDEQKMRALFEALADHVEGLGEDELIAEVREAAQSPEDIATETRALIRKAVKAVKQQ
jgi:hypothetical protein